MYTEDYNNSNYSLRSLILKIFLILTIIVILIWIVPKFLSYKKPKKVEKEKTVSVETVKITTSSLNKLQTAGLNYFNKDNIPTVNNQSEKVTLGELIKAKKSDEIKISNTVCDVDKSYVKLTKNQDNYTMKTYLKCGGSNRDKLIYVSNYDYCKDTVLCEKQDNVDNKTLDSNSSNHDNQVVIQQPTESTDTDVSKAPQKVLSEFSKWQSYQRTSCDTKAVTCDINDTNCLKEVKIYTRKEVVGTKSTPSYTEHTALKYIKHETKTVCSNYNYVVVSNNIFRTQGNYEEILSLNKKTTNNWTYRGQISTESTPRFGGNEYYKYLGTEGSVHYYDSYKYNYPMEKVTSFTAQCSNKVSKNVNFYVVYKQKEEFSIKENVYATACYASVRTRTYN
ncbi:MAG: hypothetical protein IKO49_07015 [Bacilli bacterium]|nr:hypothetical protein [Bacilli bacterium]